MLLMNNQGIAPGDCLRVSLCWTQVRIRIGFGFEAVGHPPVMAELPNVVTQSLTGQIFVADSASSNLNQLTPQAIVSSGRRVV